MPVSGMDFVLVAIPYLGMIFLPYIAIRKISSDLGKVRNKFDITSAIISYSLIYLAAPYFINVLDNIFEKGIISVYLGFLTVFILSILIVYSGHEYVSKKE